jgi:hypothetical protein
VDKEGMDGERVADNFRVGYANYDGSRRRVSIYYDAWLPRLVVSRVQAIKVSGDLDA